MTWTRGKTSDGKPDPYYIESATHRICRVNMGSIRHYELYKIGTDKPSERIAYRLCKNDEEAKVAVEELKQIAGADGLYAGAGK